jgi:HSP20 family protein
MNRSDMTVRNDDVQSPFSVIDRVWDDWFGRRAAQASVLRPAVDVCEDEHAYHYSFELPGLRKEDVKITIEDGVLSISGERKFEDETKKRTFHRIERFYGTFHRAVHLPSAANVAKAEATFRDGVLAITMPKAEEAKPRTLQIK